VVDPSILGVNCTGTGPNGEAFWNYGKAPYPTAMLKAAVRYLRYGSNATTIPGDKEKIIANGFSSGGCGTVMLAASGNATLWNDAFEVLGAAPGRDDIYGTLGSAPIIPRDYSDQAIAFLRFFALDFSTVDKTGFTDDQLVDVKVNEALVKSFKEWVPTLGLKAVKDTGSVHKGDAITADNILTYYYPYVKDSAIKYLNNLGKTGGRAAIDAYLESSRGNATLGYTLRKDMLIPKFDSDDVTVVDLCAADGSVIDTDDDIKWFWKYWIEYVYRLPGFGGSIVGNDAGRVDYGFDKPYISPNIGDNGVLAQANSAGYTTVGTQTFGKPTDYAAAYSPFGLDWIEANTNKKISSEYRELYKMQCLSMDPMYFIRNANELGVTVAPHWFIRSGAADSIALPATFCSLATTLEDFGYDVNAGLVWDLGHAPTTEAQEFFTWWDTAKTLSVTRLYGEDRYQTSKALSLYSRSWADTDTVILASGENFPDALAASGLSGQMDKAPVVLTSPDVLSSTATDVITELQPSKVIIVGGTAAISKKVEEQAAALTKEVKRLSGKSRQETAEAIYNYVKASKWSTNAEHKTAIIASDNGFADALSIAPYAANSQSPIFLTADKGTALTSGTRIALEKGEFKRIIVVGGTASVAKSAADAALKAAGITDSNALVRLDGKDRYATSLAIAKWVCDSKRQDAERLSYDCMAIALGDTFPDSLSGGALQGLNAAPILLASKSSLNQAKSFITTNNASIKEIRFFGGTAALPGDLINTCIQQIPHDHLTWPAGNDIASIK
jgi:putative cell wall-binding protein